MRGCAPLVIAILVLGLGCQGEDELPPPPIGGGSGPAVPPVGGNGPSGNGSTLDSGTLESGTLTDGSLTDSTLTGGSTTAGSEVLVSGQLLDGPAELVPLVCYIRLHVLDSLDPGSGLPLESVYEGGVPISALPQPYTITTAQADLVGPGDAVYVSTICDVDGDGAPDSIGGWYPSLPLQPVDLPASNIDMTLDVVF